ncbi:uroporphyrinogen-III C-methyltransferase [Isoptericola jiangsuensis]|uniref:Uroporphyrinogen-III C-methyltransferase n=1 Tax=Isoptericola jiangsuensis TaxID=548579 RepID=A0A2A9EVI9_9MICO|nr:uroporphyrinogen-III C-methyltransferase [Isoptericola jiangsuensis]PFG42300.1 uroporphyrinogen-III C-methyltransferase [Isoptericola jiangsuensis]
MTDLYPLGLRVRDRLVVVVGGGPVAARRTRGLLDAGARVRVVAPDLTEPLATLVASGDVEHVARPYASGDLDGAWLVHTATGVPEVDAAVAADAEAARTFCVVASDAAAATAWVPAVARLDDVPVDATDGSDATGTPGEGGVVVAVHAGRDPRRATRLRDAVAAALDAGELPLRRGRTTGRPGRVALVGGGPGAPGLVTGRGRRLLAAADVVVTDRLGPRDLLATLADDVEVIDVGKTAGNHPVPQERINELLVEHALAGRDVVRLKGGDPYVFGRGGEEVLACRAAGVEVEVVPGVTSAVSVPASVGIPVTHRQVAAGFSVLTAHEAVDDVPGGPEHTLVLLMGVTRLATTAAALVAAGRPADTPVAVVEDGYGPRQRATFGTLADIGERAAAAQVRPPAVTVIGDVVRLAPGWTAHTAGETPVSTP